MTNFRYSMFLSSYEHIRKAQYNCWGPPSTSHISFNINWNNSNSTNFRFCDYSHMQCLKWLVLFGVFLENKKSSEKQDMFTLLIRRFLDYSWEKSFWRVIWQNYNWLDQRLASFLSVIGQINFWLCKIYRLCHNFPTLLL